MKLHLMDRRRFLTAAACTSGGMLLPAASLLATEPKVVNQPYNTLTEEQELALGRQFAAEYETKVEILANPLIDAYMGTIVHALGNASQRPQWPFQVKIVNSPAVNASAIPGGFLYIHRGLLEFVSDENEMVGALAHEVGHVVGRHTTNQLVLALMAQNLFEQVKKNLLLDNDFLATAVQRLGGPVLVMAQLRYSREYESEADLLGFYEMMRAGWHPNGLLKFFTRLQAKEGTQGPFAIMLSDHPATAERAAAIRRELASVQVPPLREQSFEFQALKLALGLLPPPPPAREQAMVRPK